MYTNTHALLPHYFFLSGVPGGTVPNCTSYIQYIPCLTEILSLSSFDIRYLYMRLLYIFHPFIYRFIDSLIRAKMKKKFERTHFVLYVVKFWFPAHRVHQELQFVQLWDRDNIIVFSLHIPSIKIVYQYLIYPISNILAYYVMIYHSIEGILLRTLDRPLFHCISYLLHWENFWYRWGI